MYHCINVENITSNCQYIHQRRIQHWVLSVIRRFYTKKLGQTEEWFCPSLYLSRRHEWTDSKRTFFFFSLKKSRFEKKSKEPEKLSGFRSRTRNGSEATKKFRNWRRHIKHLDPNFCDGHEFPESYRSGNTNLNKTPIPFAFKKEPKDLSRDKSP